MHFFRIIGFASRSTTTTSTTPKPIDLTSRKNFKIGLRRRRPLTSTSEIPSTISSTASSVLSNEGTLKYKI